MNVRFFFISVSLALLYIILIKFCIQIINYTKSFNGILFFIFTVILNILIAVFFLKQKNEKNIFIKILLISIIINFFLVVFFIFLSMNKFIVRYNISSFLSDYFFCMFEVFITGNWILPILLFSVKKTVRTRNVN